MSATVREYEIDWRRETLVRQTPPPPIVSFVVGIAKAGWVHSGNTTKNVQPYSGDEGSSVGMILPDPFRVVRLGVYVVSNSLSTPSTVTVRRNETNTGLQATIPSSGTGLFYADGDEFFDIWERLDFGLALGGTALESIDIAAIVALLIPV